MFFTGGSDTLLCALAHRYGAGVTVLAAFIPLITDRLKVLPALLYARLYSMREAISAGLLLSSRLSLMIAAAAIGVRVGADSEAVAAAVILVTVFTCTVSPILFTKIYRAPGGTASSFGEIRH